MFEAEISLNVVNTVLELVQCSLEHFDGTFLWNKGIIHAVTQLHNNHHSICIHSKFNWPEKCINQTTAVTDISSK